MAGSNGGVRRRRAVWARRVDAWRRSGLPTKEFCRRRRLNLSTFQWWRWRLGVEPPATFGTVLPDFLPVRVEQPLLLPAAMPRPEPFEVVLPTGIVVRVARDFDDEAFVRLVDCLAGRPRC